MDPRLQSRLKDLASRSRSQVFAWLLIGLWCCLLWGVWFPAGSSAAPGSLRSSWLGILLFATALPLGLFLLSRFGYRDVTSVARSIERRFPEIDQKLLTAIEPAKENESGFLRNRLVKELLAHDKLYSWGEMVPTRRLRRLWGLQWFLGIASIISLFWGFQKSVGNEASGVARVASSEWIVEPGNTEIETGSDLLVSVRFPSEYSEELKLVVDDGKGGIETYAMQRSLRDPVASVALRKLRKPFEYRVESSLRGSESYRVSLFEHPSVAESDATIHYPTYANLEDKTIRNTRRITLVDGAKVDWELTLNKPVASEIGRAHV